MLNKVCPPLPGQSSTRVRIQAIDVNLTSKPEYPICLKLLLNNQLHQRLPEVAVDQPLHWDQVTPIDVGATDYIELRAYEVHFWRKVRIGEVRFWTHQINHSSCELKVQSNTGLVPCSICFTFPRPETASTTPYAIYESATAAINRSSNVLTSMSKACDFVDAVLKIGGQLSELNPVTGLTADLCKQAWETLQQRDECDVIVAELVISMGDVMPLIDAVEDRAKITKLKTTIVDMLHLIEDASRFVIEYKSDGAAVRTVRAFMSSTAREQLDQFVRQFRSLKESFDRGMMAQITLGVEALLNDADREMLTKLITPDAGYDPSTGCLEGTRTTIRNDIHKWAGSGESSQPLFWLYGLAGCGKSTIARSVCQRLSETNRLAGAFFCKRDNEHLRKPENIASTLAANLAFAFPPYGAKLVTALRQKPQLATSALAIRFREMIVEPISGIGNQVEQQISVIIVDAVDECGTADTRTQLLACLVELSQLAPWLKIMLTSRPNEELAGFFRKKGNIILHRDLFLEDPVAVSSDIRLFIRDRLAQLMDDDEALSGSSWLDDETVTQLAARANGLFIWARTTCNVICNSVNPNEKIRNRLAGKPSRDTNEQLGLLYTTVLNEALGGVIDDAHKIRCCIAVIILTRIPLVDTALADLLAGRISIGELRLVIRRLASVLYRDQKGMVRVLHQSFSDYMAGERCPADYRMKKNDDNIVLATSCLQIMIRELRFNICELQDSRQYNHEIPDLTTRIQEHIRPHLEYSCVYWTNHLSVTPVFDGTSQLHKIVAELLCELLLGPRALYWIEALSLLERLYASEASLLELIDWMQEPSHEISIHASELQRFVAAFYSPISQSTPHLYISAVAFGSEQFETVRALKDKFPNVVQVALGKHLGKISNRWLRVIQHSSPVLAVAYSADGKLLATGSGQVVQVWEARTCTAILNPLEGHSGLVTSVAFSPDGQHLVSGSQDKTVRVWNLRTGAATLNPLEGHSGTVTSVIVSPTGRYIVSGSFDSTVRVWDLYTGSLALDPIQGHSFMRHTAISPDGHHIISASSDNIVHVWDVRTGATPPNLLTRYHTSIHSVALSHDSCYAAFGTAYGAVHVWNLGTKAAALDPIQGHSNFVTSVVFSRDGLRIASGSDDGTVCVWDRDTGAPALDPLGGHSGGVKSVAFSPSGQHVLSGSSDKTARIWDLTTRVTNLTSLQGHTDRVAFVAFSPDGQHIFSGSENGTVCRWDLHTRVASFTWLQEWSFRMVDYSIAISPDGQYAVAGSWDKTVHVWDMHTGVPALSPLQGHSGSVTSVACSPDGRHIVSGSGDTTVRLWDLGTGVVAQNPLQGHSNNVTSVSCSSDSQKILSGSKDMTIRVWDLSKGTVALNPLQGHSNTVSSVAFSPDAQRIVSGSLDKTVRVWDLRAGAIVFNPPWGHSEGVTSVSFSPDDQHIASSSYDGTVRVWDLRKGTASFDPLQGHSGPVEHVAFSPTGQHIASGSRDNTVRLWDIVSLSVARGDLPDDFAWSASPPQDVMSHQLADSFTLTHDGWVLDRIQRPLLWLPSQLQRRRVDRSIYALSSLPSDHPVSFDFSKFKCGNNWVSIRDSTAI